MNSQLPKAIEQLYWWQYGSEGDGPPTNFHSGLFSLIHKADPENKARLAVGFPNEVMAWQLWCAAEDPVQFFKDAGVWKEPKGLP